MTFKLRGQGKSVSVPNTWIPVDLTSQIPDLQAIKENEDFLSHFRKKTLVVISQEVAESVLEQEDAIAEYNRIYDIKERSAPDESSFMINIGQGAGNDKALRKPQKVTAGPKVLSIVNKKDISENNKIAALKNIQAELGPDDYQYILNIPKSNTNEKLKSWAYNRLNH